MRKRLGLDRSARLAAALILILQAHSALAQPRKVKPGLNLFSIDQDIQLGKEYAAQVEKEMAVAKDPTLSGYIERIGKRLSAAPEAGQFPYSFKVVQDKAVNAFALPGGPTFVNTGLILAAQNEAMLAGVIAHEISHVALRHGTNQASKQQLITLPAMLGGAMAGGKGGLTGMLAQLGIGLGANSILLKYSRNAERDADILGARMMHQAGYNPIEMARFFELLEGETGKSSAFLNFLSSHPSHGSRVGEVQKEIRYLPKRAYDTGEGDFENMKKTARALPEVKAKQPLPQQQGGPAGGAPHPPSGAFRDFQGQDATFAHPDNWEVFQAQNSREVTIAPRSGLVKDQSGNVQIVQGIIANFRPSQQQNPDLRQETRQLLDELRRSNPSMQLDDKSARNVRVSNHPAYMVTLYSESGLGGREVDTLLTVQRPNGLFYMVFVTPESQFEATRAAFEQVLRSIRFPTL